MQTESFHKSFNIKTERELDSLIKAFEDPKPLKVDKNTKTMTKEDVIKLFKRIEDSQKADDINGD